MVQNVQQTPQQNLAAALAPSTPATQPVQSTAAPQLAAGLQQAPPGVGAPANPQEQQQRKAGWQQVLENIRNDPDMLMTLMTVGGAMMGNVQPGQSTGQHIAGAVGQGFEYQGRLAGLRQQIEERKTKQAQEQQRVDLDTAQEERVAGREELARDKLKSEAELNRARAKNEGITGGAKPGAQQQLIRMLAKNNRKLNPGMSEAEAVDKAAQRVLEIKKAPSFKEAWLKVYQDLSAFGTPSAEEVRIAKESLRREYGETATGGGDQYDQIRMYQGKRYGLPKGAESNKQENWREL